MAADVPATKDFFIEQLGFRETENIIFTDGTYVGAWLSVSNLTHELSVMMDQTGARGRFHHVCFWYGSPQHVADAAEHFREHGITLETAPGKHGVAQGTSSTSSNQAATRRAVRRHRLPHPRSRVEDADVERARDGRHPGRLRRLAAGRVLPRRGHRHRGPQPAGMGADPLRHRRLGRERGDRRSRRGRGPAGRLRSRRDAAGARAAGAVHGSFARACCRPETC